MKPRYLVVILIVGGLWWRAHLIPPTIVVIDQIELTKDFAQDLLHSLGNPAPTLDIIRFVHAWQRAEGTNATFNPLATTQKADGATCFNYLSGQCGVKNYTSYEQGLIATLETLTNGAYPHIVHGLQTNDVEEALNDNELGTWGTGRGAVKRNYDELQTSTSELRTALVNEALALRGIPYISGGRSADGGDCSGTMQYIFKTVAQVDIGATTYTQLENTVLSNVHDVGLLPGDLWYGQYSDDQHVGMIADVDSNGTWDLINNGGLASNMHVDYDFMSLPYFSEHTIGFRSVL